MRFPILPAVLLPLCLAAPLHAENAPLVYSGTGSALADDPAEALSRYLRVLAANPRDLSALTGAGRAALQVGDASAALGFYARADQISPKNGRIKAGLASALVQLEQPREALRLFDQATDLGVPVADIAGDRGLAHDLRGDNRKAQGDYTIALREREDTEITCRLALSMAISGDREGALTMLAPLLRQQDKGAQRTRALVLALVGDSLGASNAVASAMPGPQAAAMLPFLTRLAELKPAQKAAAVHFGHMPSTGKKYSDAELFADAGPSVASSGVARRVAAPKADAPLIPSGVPLGQKSQTAAAMPARNDPVARAPRRRPGLETAEIAPKQVAVLPKPVVAKPARPPKEDRLASLPGTLSELADAERALRSSATASPSPKPAPARVVEPVAAPPPVATAVSVRPAVAGPTVSGEPTTGSPPKPAPAAAMKPQTPVKKTELKTPAIKAEAKVDPKARLAAKTDPKKDAGKKADAKKPDVKKPDPKKPEPKASAKKTPTAAERYWVQVASGTNKAALGKVWTKLKADKSKFFSGRAAWTTPWRASNRLLTGPFKSEDDAQAFVNQLAKGGMSTIQFTTRAGMDVERVQ